MADYWLRVEGQNLSAFVLDTQDLSTIRGGSLALLGVIHKLPEEVQARAGISLSPITTGASIGVWSFSGERDAPAKVVAATRKALAGEGLTHKDRGNPMRAARHGTFSIAVMPAPASADAAAFQEARESAIAITRRSQMSSANVVYPADAPITTPKGVMKHERDLDIRVCATDLVRPARGYDQEQLEDDIVISGRNNPPVSQSVWDRRGYGLLAKQRFYSEQLQGLRSEHAKRALAAINALNGPSAAPFAFQISSISEGGRDLPLPDKAKLRPSLSDKIAVIYMDGNGFGKIQQQYIDKAGSESTPLDRQIRFDQLIQGYRRELLAKILDLTLASNDPSFPKVIGKPADEEKEVREQRNERKRGQPYQTDNVIRFETLRWGGDELMFVMPARVGWRVLELIIQETSDWNIDGVPLTHAIGMVYCHHDAPIARIDQLARKLADHAKDLGGRYGSAQEQGWGRKNTLVFPIILESFDHIGEGLDDYLTQMTPRMAGTGLSDGQGFFVLEASDVTPLALLAAELAGVPGEDGVAAPIARRRLRRAAQAIHSATPDEDRFSAMKLLAKCKGLEEPPATDIARKLGRDRTVLMLENLWDYLTPILFDSMEDEIQ